MPKTIASHRLLQKAARFEVRVMADMQLNQVQPNGILFVCTGNICRSPMAAAMARGRAGIGYGCIVRSAGTKGIDGHPAHPLALEQMHKRDVDISDHRARTITPNLLTTFDLILVMETEHRMWIEARMPSIQGRIHLLGRWRDLEIVDPVNGGRGDFERVVDDIDQCLGDWSDFLQEDAVSVARL